MKYPRVGEYWYVRINQDDIWLCECVGRIGDNSIMRHAHCDFWGMTQYKTIHANSSNSYKWEPNWFYKLLGYR